MTSPPWANATVPRLKSSSSPPVTVCDCSFGSEYTAYVDELCSKGGGSPTMIWIGVNWMTIFQCYSSAGRARFLLVFTDKNCADMFEPGFEAYCVNCPVQQLRGRSSGVNSVAFSPDSALVASASSDKTVRLWRCDTGECVQKENMVAVITSLSFKPDGSRLLTSLGAIALPKLPFVGHAAAQQISTPPVGAELRNDHRVGYGFSEDRSWITWYGRNLLWLPAEFRPGSSAVSGRMVVIGCNSGRVTFIQFNTEEVSSY